MLERPLERPPGAALSLDEAKLAARASAASGAPRFSSLYEALNAKREAADADKQERERTRFHPAGLDEDDADFLAIQAADAALAVRATASQADADRAAFEEALEARGREDGERRRKAEGIGHWGIEGGKAEGPQAHREALCEALREARSDQGAEGSGSGSGSVAHKRRAAAVIADTNAEDTDESAAAIPAARRSVKKAPAALAAHAQEAAEAAAVYRAAAASRARDSATKVSLPPPPFIRVVDVVKASSSSSLSMSAPPPALPKAGNKPYVAASLLASLVDYESESDS